MSRSGSVANSINEIFAHFPVSVRADDQIVPQELDAAMTGIFAFLGEHLTLAVNGTPVALERGAYHAYPAATFVRLELSRPVERAPAGLALAADAAFFERFGSRHINLVKITTSSSRRPRIAGC